MHSLRFFICLLGFGCSTALWAQQHTLEVRYDSIQQSLEVNHRLRWVNTTQASLNELILLDWNHAYHSNQTPLAQRLTEEFDRSFYLSKKSKLGSTQIREIQSEGERLKWFRSKSQADVIRISLDRPISPGEARDFEMSYILNLPSAKFTGYGYKGNGELSLKYWHLMPALHRDGQWKPYSHLNLEDYGGVNNNYKITFDGVDSFEILTNLSQVDETSFEGECSAAFFDWVRESDFEEYTLEDNKTILTDFDSKQRSKISRHASILRITDYFEKVLDLEIPQKLWVQKEIYNRYPFYGLNQLPEIVSPFSDEFHFEVRFLKAFAYAMAEHHLRNIDRREQFGLFHGLQIYWILKYMEVHHPHQKFIGRLSQWKILKPYEISRMPFNGGFWFFNALTQTANLQQADRTPGDQLTRFNARVSVPYHMGLGWFYLDHFLGDSVLANQLQILYPSGDLTAFQSILEQLQNDSFAWLFEHYFAKRTTLDIRLEINQVTSDSLRIQVSEKNGLKLPYRLDWVQKNGTIDGEWKAASTMDRPYTIAREDAAYLSVNASELWPDQHQKNHWRKNSKSQLKPLRLTFLKDLQSPRTNQLFYNPSLELNAYDGLSLGVQLYNKPIRQPKFEFNVNPQYSAIQRKLVGRFNFQQRLLQENSSNYLTLLSFLGNQYHYDEGLKYSILAPSVNFFFRPDDLRSNYRERLSLAYYQVHRETGTEGIFNSPNYQVFNISYQQSNRAAINFMNRRIDFDLSESMGKIYTSLDYRKLFQSGRQFSIRLFAGKFIYHNRRDITFFDFNLNRPTDYLFRYPYLGRSETSGLLGQQFIPAEGSFKSIIKNSSANDFLVATNLGMGLWRWVEGYLDVGILRNSKTQTKAFFGTGIRLNLLPDYLEIYFPIHSSNGFESFDNQYLNNIRVLFTLDPKTLSGLFTRTWF